MKITRLSSIEVANISVLPFEKKRAALLAIESGHSWGYLPVHDALPKLLIAEGSLFPSLPADDDEALIAHIRKSCKRGTDQEAANEAVARAILQWRKTSGATGRVVITEPLRMSVDTLKYCADVAVVLDGALYIIALDCRSSLTLKADGQEFMKSLIHHTARIGDLRDASVAVLRTPKIVDGKRAAVFEVLKGEPKYSLEQVLKMVTETYTIWETILRARKSDTGDAGSGFI
jgi:hypothetical protein